MATYFNIPVWKIPRTEEPGRLQSKGSQRVGQYEPHTLFFRFLPCSSLSDDCDLSRKIPWRRKMVIYSNILAWKIPWTEEPGRLQFKGSQRVGKDETHILFRFLPSEVAPYFLGSSHEQEGGLPIRGLHSASCHGCNLWQPKGVKMEKLILLQSLIPNFDIPSQFFCFVYAADTSGSFSLFLLSFLQWLWSSVGELFC